MQRDRPGRLHPDIPPYTQAAFGTLTALPLLLIRSTETAAQRLLVQRYDSSHAALQNTSAIFPDLSGRPYSKGSEVMTGTTFSKAFLGKLNSKIQKLHFSEASRTFCLRRVATRNLNS